MNNSTKLRQIFAGIIESDNVYFNPQDSIRLKYPCIIFNEAPGSIVRADNELYKFVRKYEFKYITKDPDETMVDKLLKLPMCSPGRIYASDNLYHYTFIIYY